MGWNTTYAKDLIAECDVCRCIEFALGIACAVFSGSLLDQPMGCRAKGTHHFKHEVHKLELAIPSNRPMRCRTKGTHGTKQRNSAST
eukprot:scaffold4970_cov18-Tisochrysis_lutea.AAC.1